MSISLSQNIHKNQKKGPGLLIILLGVLYAKAVLYHFFAIGAGSLGGGNDSEYYHAYALGYDNNAVNIWPVLLRALNEAGLYSREGVSLFLVFLSLFALPYLFFKISYTGNENFKQRIFFSCFILINIYPTLFYFTFDIYRDVFMVFVFLLGFWSLKICLHVQSSRLKICWLAVLFLITVLLYLLRPYLGAGFLCAICGGRFYNFKSNYIWLSCLVFFAALQLSFHIGFFDSIINYRQTFSSVDAGANLGINFASPLFFLVSFVQSLFYQLFGIFFVNFFAVLLFLFESVPFLFCIFYVVKNRKYSSCLVNYLMIFFVSYSTIWLLGNDNLGTAIRLRVFSYIVIFIAFFIIYQNKSLKNRSEGK